MVSPCIFATILRSTGLIVTSFLIGVDKFNEMRLLQNSN